MFLVDVIAKTVAWLYGDVWVECKSIDVWLYIIMKHP